MQRQSLGSPSKLQISAGKEDFIRKDEEDDQKARKEVLEVEEKKADKKLLKSSTCRTEKSIHLIPVLTIFCFLVLYLTSYDPSQKEMANAGVLEGYFRARDPAEMGEFGRFVEMGKSASSAFLGRRNLKEDVGSLRRSDLHRKFGIFFRKEE